MLFVRVAQGWERSTILFHMVDPIEDCLHSEGLRVTSGSEYCCPVCEECLDLDGVAGGVRRPRGAGMRLTLWSKVTGSER